MTVNRKAMLAFREAVAYVAGQETSGAVLDDALSAGLTAALREMYTDSRVSALTVDSETGSVFAAMTDGRVYEYKQDVEGEEARWAWVEMPPIPGSIAAGGKDSA